MKTLFASLAFLLLPVALFGQLGGIRASQLPVNGSGVTLCGPVTLDTAGNAIAATTSNVANPMWIAVGTVAQCGTAVTSGNVSIGAPGSTQACIMDNSVTNTGYVYILNSTITTSGPRCIASTTAPSAGTFVIGYLSSNTSSTTAGSPAPVLIQPFLFGGGSSGGGIPVGGAASIPVANSSATAYAPQNISQDCTLAYTGLITCLKTNNVAFGPFATAGAPSAGVLNWTGSVFSTSYTVGTTANNLLQLNGSGQAPVNAAGLYQASGLPNGTTCVTQVPGDSTAKCATDAFVLANAGTYPSGTGIAAVVSGTSWGPVYNASTLIPANFLANIPIAQVIGTAAYQWFYSGATTPFAAVALPAPTTPASVYQYPCSQPGSAPVLCPPGINTASITISTSATLPATDASAQVTLLGSGILNIPTTATLALPAYAALLVNATGSAITLCAGYTDSTCSVTSTGSQIESATALSPAASLSLPSDQSCLLTVVSSTLWQCKLSGSGSGSLTSIFGNSGPAITTLTVPTGDSLSPTGSGNIEANALAQLVSSVNAVSSVAIEVPNGNTTSAMGNLGFICGGNTNTGQSCGVLMSADTGVSSATAGHGGSIELVPGGTQSGTTTLTVQGLLVAYESFEATTSIAAFDLLCLNGTGAKTVSDCAANPTQIAGISSASLTPGSNPETVSLAIAPDDYFINASAAVTLGHTVCAGATAHKVTDSGGTGTCATGITVGVVEDVSNTYTLPDNSSQAASTTLPLVQITSMQATGIPWPSGSTAGFAEYSGSSSWESTVFPPLGTDANLLTAMYGSTLNANNDNNPWCVDSNFGASVCNTTLQLGRSGPSTGGTVGQTGTLVLYGAPFTSNYNSFSIAGQSGVGASSAYTITIPANTGTLSEPNLAETITALKTFTNSDIALLGSSTGSTTLASANASATNYTLTFPANTGTAAELNLAQTFTATQTFPSASITNAELANPATTVNGQTCTLGSTCTVSAGNASGLTFGATTQPLGSTAPSMNQYLQWNGTEWVGNSGGGYTGPCLAHYYPSSLPLSDQITAAGAFATTISVPTACIGANSTIAIRAHGVYTTSSTASPKMNWEVNAGGTTGICPAATGASNLATSTSNGYWDITCNIQINTAGSSGTAVAWGAWNIGNATGDSSITVTGLFTNASTGTVTYNTSTAETVGIQETGTLVTGQTYNLTALDIQVTQ